MSSNKVEWSFVTSFVTVAQKPDRVYSIHSLKQANCSLVFPIRTAVTFAGKQFLEGRRERFGHASDECFPGECG
jgi:hypothetical protein